MSLPLSFKNRSTHFDVRLSAPPILLAHVLPSATLAPHAPLQHTAAMSVSFSSAKRSTHFDVRLSVPPILLAHALPSVTLAPLAPLQYTAATSLPLSFKNRSTHFDVRLSVPPILSLTLSPQRRSPLLPLFSTLRLRVSPSPSNRSTHFDVRLSVPPIPLTHVLPSATLAPHAPLQHTAAMSLPFSSAKRSTYFDVRLSVPPTPLTHVLPPATLAGHALLQDTAAPSLSFLLQFGTHQHTLPHDELIADPIAVPCLPKRQINSCCPLPRSQKCSQWSCASLAYINLQEGTVLKNQTAKPSTPSRNESVADARKKNIFQPFKINYLHYKIALDVSTTTPEADPGNQSQTREKKGMKSLAQSLKLRTWVCQIKRAHSLRAQLHTGSTPSDPSLRLNAESLNMSDYINNPSTPTAEPTTATAAQPSQGSTLGKQKKREEMVQDPNKVLHYFARNSRTSERTLFRNTPSRLTRHQIMKEVCVYTCRTYTQDCTTHDCSCLNTDSPVLLSVPPRTCCSGLWLHSCPGQTSPHLFVLSHNLFFPNVHSLLRRHASRCVYCYYWQIHRKTHLRTHHTRTTPPQMLNRISKLTTIQKRAAPSSPLRMVQQSTVAKTAQMPNSPLAVSPQRNVSQPQADDMEFSTPAVQPPSHTPGRNSTATTSPSGAVTQRGPNTETAGATSPSQNVSTQPAVAGPGRFRVNTSLPRPQPGRSPSPALAALPLSETDMRMEALSYAPNDVTRKWLNSTTPEHVQFYIKNCQGIEAKLVASCDTTPLDIDPMADDGLDARAKVTNLNLSVTDLGMLLQMFQNCGAKLDLERCNIDLNAHEATIYFENKIEREEFISTYYTWNETERIIGDISVADDEMASTVEDFFRLWVSLRPGDTITKEELVTAFGIPIRQVRHRHYTDRATGAIINSYAFVYFNTLEDLRRARPQLRIEVPESGKIVRVTHQPTSQSRTPSRLSKSTGQATRP